MESRHQRIYDKILCLHDKVEKLTSEALDEPALEYLGIRTRQVRTTLSGRVLFSPCFFKPGKTDDNARRAGRTSSISSSSGDDTLSEDGPRDSSWSHPATLETCACENQRALPRTWHSNAGPVLRTKGATERGRWPRKEELELSDINGDGNRWEVQNIFEDHAHQLPHAIFDIHQSGRVVNTSFPSLSEIRAIVRVIRTRMAMEYYQHHVNYPVLVLSYRSWRYGRILQAHHDGRRLIVQFTQPLNFNNLRATPQPLQMFSRYYCSKPVNSRKKEDGSWVSLRNWKGSPPENHTQALEFRAWLHKRFLWLTGALPASCEVERLSSG